MSINLDHERKIKNRAVRAVREHTGLHEHLAVPIVDEIYDAIHSEFGRERVYFTRSKEGRDAAVLSDFKGNNHTEVCRKHGISRRTLYRILKKR